MRTILDMYIYMIETRNLLLELQFLLENLENLCTITIN